MPPLWPSSLGSANLKRCHFLQDGKNIALPAKALYKAGIPASIQRLGRRLWNYEAEEADMTRTQATWRHMGRTGGNTDYTFVLSLGLRTVTWLRICRLSLGCELLTPKRQICEHYQPGEVQSCSLHFPALASMTRSARRGRSVTKKACTQADSFASAVTPACFEDTS